MKNVLIIYATREGQTEKVATTLASDLSSLGATVTIYNAKDPFHLDLNQFNLLIFGASMHAGGIEQELINFIENHQNAIEQTPNAFFLVLLSAATKDKQLREKSLADALRKMKEQIKIEFNQVEMIAGALKYSKYSLPLKWIMKRIAKQAGEGTNTSQDYEYTDWNQVKKFAERLVL